MNKDWTSYETAVSINGMIFGGETFLPLNLQPFIGLILSIHTPHGIVETSLTAIRLHVGEGNVPIRIQCQGHVHRPIILHFDDRSVSEDVYRWFTSKQSGWKLVECARD